MTPCRTTFNAAAYLERFTLLEDLLEDGQTQAALTLTRKMLDESRTDAGRNREYERWLNSADCAP